MTDAPKRVKPKTIEIGRAYRMGEPFMTGPSDQIAVVTEIRHLDRRCRTVKVEWLHAGPVFSTFNYSEFPRRVWCEEPRAIQ